MTRLILHFVWEFKDGINSSLSDFYVIIYNCVHEVKTLKYSFESLVTSLKLYILKQENTQPETNIIIEYGIDSMEFLRSRFVNNM